jgi:DNA polymerase-1
MDRLSDYREIWLVDFEFLATPGDRPVPVCLVARELRSGRLERAWLWDAEGRRVPPHPTGPDVLVVAYFASAEIGCYLALGWEVPARILDLYAEFRRGRSGLGSPGGFSLLGASATYGLHAIDPAEKESMRELIMGGDPWSGDQQVAILDYCQSDVDALAPLLFAMLDDVDLARALLRGRFMAAVARMEWAGIPIDVETLNRLSRGWEGIQDRLIAEIDADFGVYSGRSFSETRWGSWLSHHQKSWPLHPSGHPKLDDDTFREMARVDPAIAPIRELRGAIAQMRRVALTVGSDGRNRCLLGPFGSKTGRNQPSNAKFAFGPSAWFRGLIKPEADRALAYVDWSQQEFGIAAALSGDSAMMAAYRSGDPYLAFGKQAGMIPSDGTKATHGLLREQFKACVLGVQYGMGAESLALRIRGPVAQARDLLRMHRSAYPQFWAWSQSAVEHAMLHGHLDSVFGWRVHSGLEPNPRSLANFPMQANGAEMLRLACCLATERGIEVMAPVHDAVLIGGAADAIDDEVTRMQAAMAEASSIVLDGFELRSDAKIVRWPDRYMDDRGLAMWDRVMRLLAESEQAAVAIATASM